MIIPKTPDSRKTKTTWKPHSFSQHAKFTLGWLMANAPHFRNLTYLEVILIKLFWTRRSFSNSLKEITKQGGMADKHAAFLLMNQLAAIGFLDIKKQMYKRSYQGRSYYKLTYKGQKLLKMILNKAFKATVISPEFFPIEMVGNYTNFAKKTRENLKKSESSKNKSNHISKLLLLRSTNKKNKLRQSADCGNFSFEKERFSFDWGIFASLPHQILAKRVSSCYGYAQKRPGEPVNLRNRDLKQEYDYFKNCERRSIFKKFGFARAYDEKMHIGIWRVLEKEPMEKIVKALKLIRKKLLKGHKLKSFTGFFTHLMKKEGVLGFGAFKAAIYRDAIDGKITPDTKQLMRGNYCSQLVDAIRSIEKDTGEALSNKDLERVLSRRSLHVALRAIQAVKFRRNCYQINSWVALWVYATNLGSVEAIHEHFFVRKEDQIPRMPLLPGSPA